MGSLMKKYLITIIKKLWQLLIGKELSHALINIICKLSNFNLLILAYKQIGILNYEDSFVSGEEFVIKDILTREITKPNPIFFDVGANVGDYSINLRSKFPKADIYAFEPNPHSYKILNSKFHTPQDHCHCIGLGSTSGPHLIYTYSNSLTSQHASIYKDVFKEIHREDYAVEVEIELLTINDFCEKNNIQHIDFIKIDTEGNELDVLKGASRLLAAKQIKLIQFEFNEMNVISRTYLKDFYNLLIDFDIFRIDTNRLIPLNQYDTINEIFKFQNLLAMLKKI
jgi:FkbM family methyltransferase